MKPIARLFCLFAALAAPVLAADPQPPAARTTAAPAAPAPETVLVTYHIAPGREAAFLQAVKAQWSTLQKLRLVTGAPHTLVRAKEASGETSFVEVLTWVSASIPDHAPAAVLAIWDELGKLCQARAGRGAIEITEVEPVDANG